MNTVRIVGGGPAGSCAALAAIQEGAFVELMERSRLRRHKVCGEFLSPEIQAPLERLGVWTEFLSHGPARIRRMSLHFAKRSIEARLPEPAWGLSRYNFDGLLRSRFHSPPSHTGPQPSASGPPHILASGRTTGGADPKGSRIFGFKAHYEGPVEDAVELFFFRNCYVGVNCVERGLTNVCGLGPEHVLAEFGFDPDGLVASFQPLRFRLQPLRRSMSWLRCGPLVFANRLGIRDGSFRAGDALSFVDPFTGSGLVAAVKTGELAGRYAAQGRSADTYLEECRGMLKKPFEISSMLRRLAGTRWADLLAGLVPPELLFRLTRPA